MHPVLCCPRQVVDTWKDAVIVISLCWCSTFQSKTFWGKVHSMFHS